MPAARSDPEGRAVRKALGSAAALLLAGLALAGGCAHARQPAPVPTGLRVDWMATCTAGPWDVDEDGLDDRCELGLARAFAPVLKVDRRDCLWMEDAAGRRLAGGYLFAAQPIAGGVRIAYLPAYYRDCGWRGPACWLEGEACGAHPGDSELIAIDVAPTDDRRWRTVGVFLSAHCFDRSDGRCRWYRGRDLEKFAWANGRTGGAPRVWVARDKHGGYPSRGACDAGHWFYDSCDHNDQEIRLPILRASQNIGSRHHPLPAAGGCIAAENLLLGSRGAHPGTRECPWDEAAPFWGWQAAGTGAAPTSYARYLREIAHF
jgi:hypothetical protein